VSPEDEQDEELADDLNRMQMSSDHTGQAQEDASSSTKTATDVPLIDLSDLNSTADTVNHQASANQSASTQKPASSAAAAVHKVRGQAANMQPASTLAAAAAKQQAPVSNIAMAAMLDLLQACLGNKEMPTLQSVMKETEQRLQQNSQDPQQEPNAQINPPASEQRQQRDDVQSQRLQLGTQQQQKQQDSQPQQAMQSTRQTPRTAHKHAHAQQGTDNEELETRGEDMSVLAC
jgi:hypothetical protein